MVKREWEVAINCTIAPGYRFITINLCEVLKFLEGRCSYRDDFVALDPWNRMPKYFPNAQM